MGAPNPFTALLSRMGRPVAGPEEPSSAGIGNEVASQVSSIRSADPEMITRQLAQMKEIAVSLIPQTAMRIPKVANHLTGVMKALDGAIQEAQKAIAASAAVGAVGSAPTPFGSSPIGLSPAQPGGPLMGRMGGM